MGNGTPRSPNKGESLTTDLARIGGSRGGNEPAYFCEDCVRRCRRFSEVDSKPDNRENTTRQEKTHLNLLRRSCGFSNATGFDRTRGYCTAEDSTVPLFSTK